MDIGRWWERNRDLLIAAVVASLVAGIPCGLLSRVAMSVIAGAGGDSTQAPVGQLTLPGTLRIVAVPMLFGIPFALLIVWLGQRFWLQRQTVVRAALYALASLIVPGLILMSDSEFHIPGANEDIGRLAFVPAYLAYGLVAGFVGEWWLAKRANSAVRPEAAGVR